MNNPNTIIEHERYSPKMNMICDISKTKFYNHFIFTGEKTVNGKILTKNASNVIISTIK